MKKYFFRCLLLFAFFSNSMQAQLPTFEPYPNAPLAAANLIEYSFYIDSTIISKEQVVGILAATNNTLPSQTISLVGISSGVHNLFVKIKDVNGVSSIYNLKTFYKEANDNQYPNAPITADNIVKYTFYIDSTINNFAQPVAFAAAPNNTLPNQSISVVGVGSGIHTLFAKVEDLNGKSSIFNIGKFYKEDNNTQYPNAPTAAENIVKYTFYIDSTTNNMAQPISFAAAPNNTLPSQAISLTGVGSGVHTLFAKVEDVIGKSSIHNIGKFYKEDNNTQYPNAPTATAPITSVEYFIDTNPDFGAATPFMVTTGSTLNLLDSIVNIPTGLPAGNHVLYVRSKGNNWSITNGKSFLTYVSPFALTPNALNFGSVAVGYNKLDSFKIKNVSTTNKTINSINFPAPFSGTFTGPIVLGPNQELKVIVSFLPTTQLFYTNTVVITTSDGTENVTVQGIGIAPNPAWTLSPITGINFGNVQVNTTAINYFTLTNTGNIPINISQTSLQGINANMFVDSIYKTTVPIGGNTLVRVKFKPTSINSFTAKEVIKSSTPGLDSIFSVVSGAGYVPGPPPVLVYESAAPYSGIKGVNPEAGAPGTYTYRIIYKSSVNNPPQAGYPKVSIDRNADQDFIDANEGLFTMYKDGTSVDYINGVPYVYTVNHNNLSNTLGYRFVTNDANGNAANTINIAYKTGPEITTQILDLRIFANGITFSNSNPNANQPFTVYAKIENSSPFTANNIPVKFYKDSVLLDSTVVSSIAPYGFTIINKVFSFASDGFYPIKVWIDSLNTLGDGNILNNYAIRPVTVGLFSVPGGIITTAQATAQYCPAGVWIRGHAQYYGTANAVQPMVAGAEVTIIHGVDTFYTTTNADGYYSVIITQNLNCASGNFAYKVSVTDFTLIGTTAVQSIAIGCVSCGGGGSGSGIGSGISGGGFFGNPCSWVQNSNYNYNFTVTYKGINTSNFWSSWDWIGKDTVRLFQDGVKIWEVITSDKSGQVGATFNYSVPYTLNNIGQNIFKIVHKYEYHEYFNLPTSITDPGVVLPIVNEQNNAVTGVCPKPNLIINGIGQANYSIFKFTNYNQSCFAAGSHIVRLYDSIPNGNYVLIETYNIATLSASSGIGLSYTFPVSTFGWHHLKMITDVNNTVDECFENDNTGFYNMYIPRPELSVNKIDISNHNPTINQLVNLQAIIQNTSSSASTFKVQFLANGVAIGAKVVVPTLNANSFTTVFSSAYTMPSADVGCPINFTVVVDVDNEVIEENETNNSRLYIFGSDIKPVHPSYKGSSAANPFIMYRGINSKIKVPIKNYGYRTVSNVNVKYALGGNSIGNDVVPKALYYDSISNYNYYDSSGFFYTFNTAGNYVLDVSVDTLNSICEIIEANNTQPFYIQVLQGLADFEELSQYISPSNLNPNPGQSITIVGTVENRGNVPTAPNLIRFMVDGVQLGTDVPINALMPGRDTTVACTASFVSNVVGPVVVKIIADLNNIEPEIREDNNEATRAVIYGNAPDFARSQLEGLKFNPNGFVIGDSVTISNYIRNYGGAAGTAWLRFKVKDDNGNLVLSDSVLFTIGAIDSALISKKIVMPITNGKIYSEIVNSNPVEFNFFNNNDSLPFTSVYSLQQSLTSTGNLKMKSGNSTLFPGWVGGYILLGNNDLIVNGIIEEFSDANFIITNGTGKLIINNTDAVKTFPIGTSTNSPNFLTINNTGTPDVFKAQVREGVQLNGNTGAAFATGNVNRTWNIEEGLVGGSNAALTFNWLAAQEQPLFTRASSTVGHYIGSQWVLGNAGAATLNGNGWWQTTQSGFTSFSPFIVTNSNSVLAIDKIVFKAIKVNDYALLKWTTINEQNMDNYQLQKSIDGFNFTVITTVNAKNHSINNYEFYDNTIVGNGIYYYRLKIVDKNGDIKFSTVEKLVFDDKELFTVYPKITNATITITSLKPTTINIVSADGKLVMQKLINGNTILNLTNLANGVYFVCNVNGKYSISIIKQ